MRMISPDEAKKIARDFFVNPYDAISTCTVIDKTPTIDAVPVVRCRDCKWFNHYTMECESDDVATDREGGALFSINFGPDDFCSYGQRKEADHG